MEQCAAVKLEVLCMLIVFIQRFELNTVYFEQLYSKEGDG